MVSSFNAVEIQNLHNKLNVNKSIDISPNMLEEASNKMIYKELDEHTLCDPENYPEKFKNKHDFVTCAGLIKSIASKKECWLSIY